MPIIRTFLNTAAFCLGLAGVCAAIGSALPAAQVGGAYNKLRYFDRHKDQIDVAFLGSSHIYRGVIPGQFDAQVAAISGREVRSFNAAYDAVWPPESLYVTRKLLALKSPRLRWLFIECMNANPELPGESRHTQRVLEWHDARHTAIALATLRDFNMRPLHAWDLATTHAAILLRRWTNQGHGAEQLTEEFGLKRRKGKAAEDPGDLGGAWGYRPQKDSPLPDTERRMFLAKREQRKQGMVPQPKRPSVRAAYAALLRDIRAAGIEPIVLVPPTVLPHEHFKDFPPEFQFWRFDDPSQYAAIYDPANWHDVAHLNHAGAGRFTSLLAERFAAMLKAQP